MQSPRDTLLAGSEKTTYEEEPDANCFKSFSWLEKMLESEHRTLYGSLQM